MTFRSTCAYAAEPSDQREDRAASSSTPRRLRGMTVTACWACCTAISSPARGVRCSALALGVARGAAWGRGSSARWRRAGRRRTRSATALAVGRSRPQRLTASRSSVTVSRAAARLGDVDGVADPSW